jgi:cytoskeletal protein CcmA (bactofilin family)
MSLLNLKNKIEPNYFQSQRKDVTKEVFQSKPEPEVKTEKNSSNSLLIGEGVTITGTIKADNEVNIQGAIDGDIDCNSVTINKSGNVKGKVKAETMTIEGKVEGEININSILHIKSKGNVSGKIFYGEIEIDTGGKLSGEINHRDKDNKQEEFKDLKFS